MTMRVADVFVRLLRFKIANQVADSPRGGFWKANRASDKGANVFCPFNPMNSKMLLDAILRTF